jgi:hypothetical protein
MIAKTLLRFLLPSFGNREYAFGNNGNKTNRNRCSTRRDLPW